MDLTGKQVRFIKGAAFMPSDLIGATGTVEDVPDKSGRHIVRLDQDLPGFYSGTAWADEDELEVLD